MRKLTIKRQRILAAAALAGLGMTTTFANAVAVNGPATFTNNAGGTTTWVLGSNWDLGGSDWPSGNAATATIDGPSAARTLQMGGPITLAGLTFNVNTTSKTTTQNGSMPASGSLTFDSAAGSTVTITVNSTTTSQVEIATTSTFADTVVADVSQTVAATSSNGALDMSALTVVASAGGFTKKGNGLATFSAGQKRYSGATSIEDGRLQLAQAAALTATSGVTVKSGGQLTLKDAGTFTLGPAGTVLTLNGTGPAAGLFSTSPGAVRNAPGISAIIPNPVVLQTDSLIHVQSIGGVSPSPGVTTLSGIVSGAGALTFQAANSNQDLGTLVLGNANTYEGGTIVNGGTLNVTLGSGLGTGPLLVNSAIPGFAVNTVVNLSATEATTTGSLSGSITGGAGSTATIDNGGQTHTINQIASGTYAGVIAGAGGLTLSNISNNTLVLTGTNTYEGTTQVLGGKLSVSTNAIPTSNNVLVSGSGAEYEMGQGGGVYKPLSLTINSGGKAVIASNGASVLDIAETGYVQGGGFDNWNGQLDIRDNDVIVRATAGTRAGATDRYTNQLKNGANFASNDPSQFWKGNGIVSSLAGGGTLATGLTAVGVLYNDKQAANPAVASEALYTIFDGQTVDVNDVLIKYTWYGDADLNGTVNTSDYFQIDQGFLNARTGWVNGDFDYSGSVNTGDYFLIDNAFLGQGGVVLAVAGAVPELRGATAVPEPTSLGVFAIAFTGLLACRRRR